MELNRDGSMLALALKDGPVRLFKTAPLRAWKSLPHTNWIIDLEFAPKGRYLAGCGGEDMSLEYEQRKGVMNIWNIDSGVLEESAPAAKNLGDLVFSPNGRHVAAIEGYTTVFVRPLPVASKAPPLADPQPSAPPTK
jgi:WD40 repeat protein